MSSVVTPPQDRRFYSAMALVLVVLVGAGFAPTFFARGWLGEAQPLALPVRLHGIAGTAWVALFAVQCALIAAHRPRWHRSLGLLGAVLTVAFVATGVMVTAGLEASHGSEPAAWRAAHVFMNGAPLAAFTLFVAVGIAQRRVAARHKRFMLLAAVVLLPPAVGRLFGHLDLARFNLLAYASLAFANALYDWGVRGRPHVVSLLGATTLVAIDITTTEWLEAVGS